MRTFWLCAVALLAASCQEATGPSALPPRPDELVITPPVEALKIGEGETLAALLIRGNGTRVTVPAAWSSDAPHVASVSSDGRVLAVGLGTATIRATFEALSAQRSLRVVPDFGGSWRGEYRITGCTRTSGSGPDVCRNLLTARFPLALTLAQSGALSAGTLDFYDNTGRALVESGPVEGSIDDGYALLLSGTTRSVDPVHPSETAIADWRTTLTEDRARMIGRFVRNQSFVNFWGPQRLREECEITRLERASGATPRDPVDRGKLARWRRASD
ncbi:MAG TPA: Ig-like domain-containing protein [Vicinamibacterales bacterium]|nr:Ig-like domain-containing protein [Vicinamibacterales bacterium]